VHLQSKRICQTPHGSSGFTGADLGPCSDFDRGRC
jgi:hypothetical protein